MEARFYHDSLQQEDMEQQHIPDSEPDAPGQSAAALTIGSMAADAATMSRDAFDDMIRASQGFRRRRSVPHSYAGALGQDSISRRLSVMEFDSGGGAFGDFTFTAPDPRSDLGDMTTSMATSMAADLAMAPAQMAGYDHHRSVLALGAGGDFSALSPDRMPSMTTAAAAFTSISMDHIQSDPPHSDVFATAAATITTQYSHAPINALTGDFAIGGVGRHPASASGHATPSLAAGVAEHQESDGMAVPLGYADGRSLTQASLPNASAKLAAEASSDTFSLSSAQSPPQHASVRADAASTETSATTPTVTIGPTPPPEHGRSVYSSSGFDIMRLFALVISRKNPEINLGKVDLSCAFVVCDVTKNDCPIIYISDNFQNLTGYSRHEIVGKNCRFLQSPSGIVEAGSRREFVDDGAVLNLKQKIGQGKEVQQSLINYRKGGRPFLNLLTMIPVPWDSDEIRYIIGFQIDLVACPEAVESGRGPSDMQVNYARSQPKRDSWMPPPLRVLGPENGQTFGTDEVSAMLQQCEQGDTLSDWHRQNWDKMLIENADDMIYVLSLKCVFHYLSPACKQLLEYDAGELIGHPLINHCHPSDNSVTFRDIRDMEVGKPVTLTFRLKKKRSGYIWLESHGALFAEPGKQGKGRKCIIFVARRRPMFSLSRQLLQANAGIGDNDFWAKISPSGLFLFVSANVRPLLDLQPDGLIGTGIQDMMRKESKTEFGRLIEKARRGWIVTCKHEVQNKRGQVLQAQTTLYPGDGVEGTKSSFLLAQTRLVKASSRAIAPATATATAATTSTTAPAMMATTVFAPQAVASQPAASGGQQADQDDANLPAAVSGTPTGFPAALASSAISADPAPTSSRSPAAAVFSSLEPLICGSWPFQLHSMEKNNRILAEELAGLLANKKKRKRRKGVGNFVRDCANCHTRNTPEWRRGPSGQRDLCNSCGLRYAKKTGRVSPRNSTRDGAASAADSQTKSSHASSVSARQSTHFGNGDKSNVIETVMSRTRGGPVGLGLGMASTTSIPPPSQPLLEGGSGVEMTLIHEEGESNAQ